MPPEDRPRDDDPHAECTRYIRELEAEVERLRKPMDCGHASAEMECRQHTENEMLITDDVCRGCEAVDEAVKKERQDGWKRAETLIGSTTVSEANQKPFALIEDLLGQIQFEREKDARSKAEGRSATRGSRMSDRKPSPRDICDCGDYRLDHNEPDGTCSVCKWDKAPWSVCDGFELAEMADD